MLTIMKKHIELVEKWLGDNNSVSPEELSVNVDEAEAVYFAVDAACDADAYNADAYAACAAYNAAACAAAGAADAAYYYVNKYKEV